MPIFIPPPKAYKTSSYACYNAREPVIVEDHFSLVMFMQPHFDQKGRLLDLCFINNDLILYKHVFELEEPIVENSPCGGLFNETLPLSKIAQAYYRNGSREPCPHRSVLEALENRACVYKGFYSYRAHKDEPSSRFVYIYFQKEIS